MASQRRNKLFVFDAVTSFRLMKLIIEVLEVVLVVVEVGEGVGKTGGTGGVNWNLDLVPTLGNLKNNTSDLGVEVVFYLVVAPILMLGAKHLLAT